MHSHGNILLIDDDDDILVAGKLLLKRHFSDVAICNRPEHIPQLLQQTNFDAILLDMNFGPGESSGEQGLHWLSQICEIQPEVTVIMITAHASVGLAVEALKQGATDFVSKPWDNQKLVATVFAAVKLSQSQREASRLRITNQILSQSPVSSDEIIGSSQAIQQIKKLIQRAAPTDANVLILGENGTGKELVARALHQQSRRASQVFMAVDLGAVSETLFESELFGHKKGAFTGANTDRIGRLQAASGGTLFLDEVGNLPLHLQAKLLSVLEQRQVTPLGANKAEPIDVRVISATNMSKKALHDEQQFRQDLLFRLNTVEIVLPALRERQADIPLLAQHYLTHYQHKYHKPQLTLSNDAIDAISAYPWPGNIRALRHAMERATILSDGTVLSAHDFQLNPSAPGDAAIPEPCATDFPPPVKKPEPQDELNLEKHEKQLILQALRQHHYNISHSAKALGLTRAALYRRMEKHGL
ncbi:sigma-54-dependent transcriptional regulator [Neptunicella marina]|uniref:Sigma-54-dependent Fis family transcriptional regulator n=1 Tax=Neptunicella marina TaxID=2125989 RepID=A0A8J6LXL1_9ALTE|nr:sigma-54 dependent transcriptional regulator [Neptunicella marina]MBC3765639.1 sigma-54-dependent Fis family transcriptional regulator [Neptunicella marina]